ncbi:bifunctional SulP family inorganic anion transporter/carbonic anhydrase [Candidatus Nitrospira nitrificans]|uniref:Sulfate permease-like transporter, MFS superfamily n=1 Tax=Candidatus Nitrospira nitrificans TaxID=1742973 RepID=A0A0S4LN04_9BACT|nr:SulP family inorganic anion transporter [Candidatus Nitrospira nitrificans]CUS38908.1 Sulfate permease-like transporter, MFS superfamily [Candidatus Nitrospira nitrificans]
MAAMSAGNLLADIKSGLVVFLVALPLCLGIALASDAPLVSGLLAGIIGGIVVGLLSGSQLSVSGPAAGLTTIVAAQILSLGSFSVFLLAVILAGLIQISLGLAKAGFIAAFFPSSVIKGLLAAIGVILILKQIPHVVGHDPDPEGEMAFSQPDLETTFSELIKIFDAFQPGASVIGLASIALLVLWSRWKPLKESIFPAPLAVVLFGVGMSFWFEQLGDPWLIRSSHLVQVPVADNMGELLGLLPLPDYTQWTNPAVYTAGLTIAIVASLETLLNLQAVDRLDPQQRTSPPSRELVAQGVGNVASGLVGGLPVTSVIIRSSVNVNAGGKTKLATIVHGTLLLISVPLIPTWLNVIPLSSLAAILLMTGIKLASPAVVKQMWNEGRYQFIPFAATVTAIVFTDLLIGIAIGMVVAIGFILNSNMRRPVHRFVERHLGGDVVHIELANQVSFLNRAALSTVLNEVPRNGHVLLDARNTDYIDPDVLDLIRDFKEQTGPAHGVEVSLVGFRDEYDFEDEIQYVDYSTRELQDAITPHQVLQILKDGNERVRRGRRLTRDFNRQVRATADRQHPLAVALSCIDSRTPVESIFDLGMGDIFSIRIAGNITSRKVLASAEYGCAVAGAKLIVVIGHTRCGAVSAAVKFFSSRQTAAEATGCQHLDSIVSAIQRSTEGLAEQMGEPSSPAMLEIVNAVAKDNVLRVVKEMRNHSRTLDCLVRERRIAIVGAMYDVTTGDIEFLAEEGLDEIALPKTARSHPASHRMT